MPERSSRVPCPIQPSQNAYGTGPYGTLATADTIVTVSQTLEVWGQRQARVRAARAEAQVAGLRSDQAHTDVAGQLSTIYAQAESVLRRYRLADEALLRRLQKC